MFHRALVCLLLASFAWGQAPSPSPAQAPAPSSNASAPATPPAPVEVAPDAAVITIKGVCPDSTATDKSSADCKTIITRAEFEKILGAISPNGVPPAARKQLATRYAMALAMSSQAEKAGLDKGPRYEEMIKLSRMQVLSQLLNQSLQEKAGQVPEADIEDYYKKNEASYQEVALQRLFIPRTRQAPKATVKLTAAQTKKQQEDGEAAMKVEAAALQKRAAAGADLAKLQAEAYKFAGIKAKPPNTDMGKIRRTALPPAHGFVMDLKTGEVSKLISDPGGSFVYKVGEKDTLPLEKVKQEIHNTLRGQRAQESMQAMQKSAQPELNDAYFAVPPPKPEPEEDEDED